MKKRIFAATAMSVFCAAVGTVQAEDNGLGIGVGARYSTLGTGIEVGKSFSDYFNIRFGINQYSQSDSMSIDNTDYSTDLDYKSTSLMLDWNPFGGSFHLTGGYLNSNNTISALATPTGTVNIGGTDYGPLAAGDVILDSSVKLGSGPYLGLGWGNVPSKGFGITIEAGVVQMGAPDVSLTVTDNAGLGISQAEIDQELANVKGDLDQFELYPVAAIGISYGF